MPCTESRGGGEPAVRMHACNSSTQKAKARGLLRVRGQPGLHSKTIPQNRRKQPHPKLKTNRKRREENWGHKRRDQTLHHWVYKPIYTCWTKGTQEQNYIAFFLTCVSKVILFCFVLFCCEGEAEFCCVTLNTCLGLPKADMSHHSCHFFFKMSFSFIFISVCVCVPQWMYVYHVLQGLRWLKIVHLIPKTGVTSCCVSLLWRST